MNRPTAAYALELLNKLLVSPNKAEIYNNFKINKHKNISNVNSIFRRESFTQQPNNNPLINDNQTINTIPNNMIKSSPINNNNINSINNNNDPNIDKFFNRMTSGISEVEEFLRPNMGKANRIKSSMK